MAVLVVAMILSSITALAGFALFLIFCAYVVNRTGGTAGLRDVGSRARLRVRVEPECSGSRETGSPAHRTRTPPPRTPHSAW